MKRFISVLLIASAIFAVGCHNKNHEDSFSKVKGQQEELVSSETTVPSTTVPTPTPTNTPTPTPSPTPKIENISNNVEGHYKFNPCVFSQKYEETFGKEMKEAFFRFCEAVRAGEDYFDCPDEKTYDWCVGNFSFGFCPLAAVYVENASTVGEVPFKDGKGKICYTIPKEEFLEKQKKFEKDIVDILDDCLSDDYSDFEKALALYEYMTKNYHYDYSMLDNLVDRSDKVSVYRCLNEKQGICSEQASLYNYLLLQAGLNSDEIGGPMEGEDNTRDSHSWVFITLGDQSYHIDPTWGAGYDCTPLNYFMMTDDIRSTRDKAVIPELQIGGQGDESRKKLKFDALDDTYSDLWDGLYIGMNREEHLIVYEDKIGKVKEFSYAS